jgi:hypothetical protein
MLFYVLGSRVTGSIAVYFHPAHRQNNEADLGHQPLSHRRILAKAEAYDGDQSFTTFGQKPLELKIEPCAITDWQKTIE